MMLRNKQTGRTTATATTNGCVRLLVEVLVNCHSIPGVLWIWRNTQVADQLCKVFSSLGKFELLLLQSGTFPRLVFLLHQQLTALVLAYTFVDAKEIFQQAVNLCLYLAE